MQNRTQGRFKAAYKVGSEPDPASIWAANVDSAPTPDRRAITLRGSVGLRSDLTYYREVENPL